MENSCRVHVYQINEELDTHHKLFERYETWHNGKIDASIYREVFDGILDFDDMEDIYKACNINDLYGFNGHSMSVSDVIRIGQKSFYCDYVGFKEIKFDYRKINHSSYIKAMVYDKGLVSEKFILSDERAVKTAMNDRYKKENITDNLVSFRAINEDKKIVLGIENNQFRSLTFNEVDNLRTNFNKKPLFEMR